MLEMVTVMRVYIDFHVDVENLWKEGMQIENTVWVGKEGHVRQRYYYIFTTLNAQVVF